MKKTRKNSCYQNQPLKRRKKNGEEEKGLSAYSVFNENQEELLGTLNAGRIDRELRGGGIAQAPHAAAAAAAQHKRPAQHSWGKGNKLS